MRRNLCSDFETCEKVDRLNWRSDSGYEMEIRLERNTENVPYKSLLVNYRRMCKTVFP